MILSFISILVLILFVYLAIVWIIRIRRDSEGNKFVQLLPYWIIAYGVSLAMICPVSAFSLWEHNLDMILTMTALGLALIFALLIIATLVVAIIQKQYRNAGRIVGIGVLLIIYSFVCGLFAGMGEGAFDHFGHRHPIPQGMVYYEPYICRSSSDEAQQDSVTISRGILLTGEWGMYSYRALVPAIPEKGEIYLKLYEATSDFPLSEANVKFNSTISVEPSDTAVIYQMEGGPISVNNNNKKYYFTIKEGSWGDYYAARVELWYQPVSADEPQLLNTAIYKIEGWSR
ncbi:MAG: hypothetical protein IKO63_03435 [Paludibacteraceae bacterium]|nr:hypothetical protein [Paludibacteraceae bacterium]